MEHGKLPNLNLIVTGLAIIIIIIIIIIKNTLSRPMTAVASDHVVTVGTPLPSDASCLPYCAVANSNHNWWGLLDGGAKPDWSCNAADPYPVEFGG